MNVSIKELREKLKKIFNAVKQGNTIFVYYHKKCIAKIIPIEQEHPVKNHDGFGMWSDYQDTEDAAVFARKLRKGRHHDL